MASQKIVDHATLAEAARRVLPACLLREAVGEPDKLIPGRLERYFRYLTNIPAFGERVVLLAGLALDALYVHFALNQAPEFHQDPVLEDHIRTLLFDRGSDLGLACAAVQRAGVMRLGPVAQLIPDDRPVTGFVTMRPTTAGNFLRGQLTLPVENQLLDLLDQVRFLSRFSFRERETTFDEQLIEVRPFLFWDGEFVWRFRSLERADVPVISWCRTLEGTETQRTFPAESLVLERIRQVAALLKVPKSVFDGEIRLEDEGLPRSFMPLFAASYPAVNRLAHQVWLKSEFETRRELWALPRARGNTERADELAKDELFVTNEVIQQCMDRDPVSALEAYFQLEQSDQREYFDWLLDKPDLAKIAFDEIREKTEAYRRKLLSFYCRADDEKQLAFKVRAYQARLAAMRVVELLGFQVVRQGHEEAAEDYRHRFGAFYQYLVDDGRDESRVVQGLMECAKSCESLLKTLVVFYEAVKSFSLDFPEGVSEETKGHLRTFKERHKHRGLGTFIGLFAKLNDDQKLRRQLREVAGRDSVWPEGSHEAPLATLGELKDWRNPNAHIVGSGRPPKADRLVAKILEFVDWLIFPGGRETPGNWRIYPAYLALNLITTNSCGISSVKYSLTQLNSTRDITLYTRQKLNVATGSLLGLPNLGGTMETLWVNPVLIPAKVLGV